jgi:hypothetical protein
VFEPGYARKQLSLSQVIQLIFHLYVDGWLTVFVVQRKARRKKEAVQGTCNVLCYKNALLFKENYNIYLQWLPSYIFFITVNSKTNLRIFDFHPNSNTVTCQGFYNKTISQRPNTTLIYNGYLRRFFLSLITEKLIFSYLKFPS